MAQNLQNNSIESPTNENTPNNDNSYRRKSMSHGKSTTDRLAYMTSRFTAAAATATAFESVVQHAAADGNTVVNLNDSLAANTTNNSSSYMNNVTTTTNATVAAAAGDAGGGMLPPMDDNNPMLHTIAEIGNILNLYYIPILVLAGSIGNILSVLVFFKTKLSKLSSSYYLAALAISDTCFLIGLFVQWLNFVDVNIYNRDNYCQFFTFFSNLACFCSSWFVVAFTVERFIAVMYPLKRQTMCTVKRAKIVLIGLTLVGIVHSTPFWLASIVDYSARLEMDICDIRTDYKELITYLNYWDSFVVFAVPFATIAILNTFTGYTVWKFATARRSLTMQKTRNHVKRDSGQLNVAACSSTYRMTSFRRPAHKTTSLGASFKNGQQQIEVTSAGVPTAVANNAEQLQLLQQLQMQGEVGNELQLRQQQIVPMPHHRRLRRVDNRKKRGAGASGKRQSQNSSQLKVTKMLLIVSTAFVCLNLPSYLVRMKTFIETQTESNSKVTLVFQYIVQVLFITSFGINFVLYCVSGQNFRKAVLELFGRVSLAHREGNNTQVTVSEYYRSGGTLTRRRMMTQNCMNELHELNPLK